MGRPPCRDKAGMKKGPWMPDEDIILVSYIQEHGPGNWRSVSINTGLMRNSQSCRLRWTNHLRPGLRRGNITPQEEDMIVQLQSLLGNRWAAIASYIPHRTDTDIKNYLNSTHLKDKLNKQQAIGSPAELTQPIPQCSPIATTNGYYYTSSSWYAFSMDNIPSLLNLKSSPTQSDATPSLVTADNNSLFSFDPMSGGELPPISDVLPQQPQSSIKDWLFDDDTEQVVHQLMMDISDGSCSVPMLF